MNRSIFRFGVTLVAAALLSSVPRDARSAPPPPQGKKAPGTGDTSNHPPKPPSGATAIVQADHTIVLRWSAAAGAQQYRIERARGAKSEFAALTTLPATSSEYVDRSVPGSVRSWIATLVGGVATKPPAPSEAHYRIIALNSNGASAPVSFSIDTSKAASPGPKSAK